MLGVHETGDPSKAPVTLVVARQTAGPTVCAPKLLNRLREALRCRHYSRRT